MLHQTPDDRTRERTPVVSPVSSRIEESSMAILMISDASEDPLAHYDQVIQQLEVAGHGHPPGQQFHVMARKGTGYVVSFSRSSAPSSSRSAAG